MTRFEAVRKLLGIAKQNPLMSSQYRELCEYALKGEDHTAALLTVAGNVVAAGGPDALAKFIQHVMSIGEITDTVLDTGDEQLADAIRQATESVKGKVA